MSKKRAIKICKNITQTLNRGISKTCTKFSQPMFDRPTVRVSVLKRQLKKLVEKYNLKEEELC